MSRLCTGDRTFATLELLKVVATPSPSPWHNRISSGSHLASFSHSRRLIGQASTSTSEGLVRNDCTSTASTSQRGSEEGESRLRNQKHAPLHVPEALLPRHIAIIMDGNARWAYRRGLQRSIGHEAGVEALRRTVRCCLDWNIPALTVFAFSAENWRRTSKEVGFILKLTEQILLQELQHFQEEGIRLQFIGSLDKLPASLKTLMARAEQETQAGSRLHLTVAFSYGGQQDVVQAVRKIANDVANGSLEASQIDESEIASRMSLARLPEHLRQPDLLIRTSGEMRLSNFLLWELAYCELYFTQTRWPDFQEADLRAALQDFCSRQRRYGGQSEVSAGG